MFFFLNVLFPNLIRIFQKIHINPQDWNISILEKKTPYNNFWCRLCLQIHYLQKPLKNQKKKKIQNPTQNPEDESSNGRSKKKKRTARKIKNKIHINGRVAFEGFIFQRREEKGRDSKM